METQHVQITTKDNRTRIFVDGKELKWVREISFSHSVSEVPIVEIDCIGHDMDIDTEAHVNFSDSFYDELVKENQALKKKLKKMTDKYEKRKFKILFRH